MAFDFDETKALPPKTPARSAWDDADEEPAAPTPPPPPISTPRMPAWDVPPPAVVAPIPVKVEPPAAVTEEQWGFDEAQIETAHRASTPPPSPAKAAPARTPIARAKVKEGGKRLGLLIALMAVFILAGAGYGGFWWWQKQQEQASAESVVVPRKNRPAPPAATTTATATAPPAATTTIVETPVTTTQTAAASTTTTQPPVTQTPITQAPPAPVATTTTAALPPVQPLPVVRPRTTTAAASTASTAGRARYDEMARQYAANPRGNFTVQIQILCDPANLEKAIRAGGDSVWFLSQQLGERSCYRVFWGRFNTREEAQRALANVPASLRDRSSAVRPVPR